MSDEPVIVDSSSLLNFVLTGSLDLLLTLPGYSFRIPPRVYAEIEPEGGREALLPAIQQGRIRVEILTDEEMQTSEAFQVPTAQGVLDPGEAQVVAIAISRNWRALVDDKAAARGERLRPQCRQLWRRFAHGLWRWLLPRLTQDGAVKGIVDEKASRYHLVEDRPHALYRPVFLAMEQKAKQAKDVSTLRLCDLSGSCNVENQPVRLEFSCQHNSLSLTPPHPNP